jgi:predicted ester cyclase
MFAALESPGDPATTEALIAQAFIEKDTGNGFARLDRYRASLERTYHRCARELRAARKGQIEANSTQMAEKKFEKLLERSLNAPPPGFEFRPKLVPADPKGLDKAANGAPTSSGVR